MTLQVDDTIKIEEGKYRIMFIKEGSFGRVYMAEKKGTDEWVAIKELRRDLRKEIAQEARKRFEREIRVGCKLNHSHIVRMYTLEQEGEETYLVMECVVGSSLKERLEREGALPPEDAVRITMQICDALSYLHEQDLVHRDVTPSNILLTEDGQAKLTDFGIVQEPDGSYRDWGKGGNHPGPEAYKSPESSKTRDYIKPRSDVYMLGSVLWEMLTGRTYKLQAPGTPPSALRPEVSSRLDSVVLEAVKENPQARYQTAADFKSALVALRAPENCYHGASWFSMKVKTALYEFRASRKAAARVRQEAQTKRRKEAELKAEEAAAQQARLDAMYGEAVQLAERGKYDRALAKMKELHRLEPKYADPQNVVSRARQQVKLDALYGEAVQLLKRERYDKALAKMKELHRLEPEYADPQNVVSQAERQVKLDTLYGEAVQFLERGYALKNSGRKMECRQDDGTGISRMVAIPRILRRYERAKYDKALAKMEELHHLEPKYADSQSVVNRAKKELQRIKATEEQKRKAELKKKRLNLKRRASSAVQAGNLRRAKRLVRRLKALGEPGECLGREVLGQIKVKQINLEQSGWLSPWNPLHWLVLLWWMLVKPDALKSYLEPLSQEGKQRLSRVHSWLTSTLTWWPFFVAVLWLDSHPAIISQMIQIEFTSWVWNHRLWLLGGSCGLLWLLTGLFGGVKLPLIFTWAGFLLEISLLPTLLFLTEPDTEEVILQNLQTAPLTNGVVGDLIAILAAAIAAFLTSLIAEERGEAEPVTLKALGTIPVTELVGFIAMFSGILVVREALGNAASSLLWLGVLFSSIYLSNRKLSWKEITSLWERSFKRPLLLWTRGIFGVMVVVHMVLLWQVAIVSGLLPPSMYEFDGTLSDVIVEELRQRLKPGGTSVPPLSTIVPNVKTPTVLKDCTFDAKFLLDVTVPDDTEFQPNVPFTKTWRLRNAGTCTWTKSTRLAFHSGYQMSKEDSVALNEVAVPGSVVDVSVNLVTPSVPGAYKGVWQLMDPDGVYFGDIVYTRIIVSSPSGNTE